MYYLINVHDYTVITSREETPAGLKEIKEELISKSRPENYEIAVSIK